MDANAVDHEAAITTWICKVPAFIKTSTIFHWHLPATDKLEIAPGARLTARITGRFGENLEIADAVIDGKKLPHNLRFIHIFEWTETVISTAGLDNAPEPIRLVIWDLDETFWHGTFTEGGMRYVRDHHNIVIDLAKRGIMSSICSKNDHEQIKSILVREGLWDYFIFPSINWDTKGPRLAALIEDVQLRAPTILFIDDSAMNRNEAAHFVPGLQIADETIIPALLGHHLCQGKNDEELIRLKQYKLLEARQEQKAAIGDNYAFLRASKIRVTIEHALEPHIDRIVELINRTNQLNFTKKRLPEDPVAARNELSQSLNDFLKHAGLIHVQDQFGDYGFVGFYLIRSYAHNDELEHFCFSCRTLGMGIESWVYDLLGRPKLNVAGEVLTDLFAPDRPLIDWINTGGDAVSSAASRLTRRIFMRGGCAMTSTAHYLALNAEDVVGEFNIAREGISVRLDHSVFLRYAFETLAPQALEAAGRLGYQPGDFSSALADDPSGYDVCVLNFHSDADYSLYRHPLFGFKVPFYETGHTMLNVMETYITGDLLNQYKQVLIDEGYEHMAPAAGHVAESLAVILPNIPDHVILFFLLSPESSINYSGVQEPIDRYIQLNDAIRGIVANRPNVYFLDVLDFVESASEQAVFMHFTRMVYYRIYQKIADILSEVALTKADRLVHADPPATT